MSDVAKVTRGTGLRRFKWGEASLWLLFGVFGVGGLLNDSGLPVTFSGIAALAAIGVRATRVSSTEVADAEA